MRNFVIVGLGRFGQCILDSLVERRLHVVVIDRDDEKVQRARDVATKAVKADAVDFELLQEVLPEGIECAIVDLGEVIGQSILVTNHLAKLKVPHIVVEAVNGEHAEILRIVGATRVVFPEEEAAKRLAGVLAGRGVLDFFAVSEDFSMIEIPVPAAWVGKTVAELKLIRTARVVVVAVRGANGEDEQTHWRFPELDRPFAARDIAILAGATGDLQRLQ
jgi:trk system potassium uptake protein TrkA